MINREENAMLNEQEMRQGQIVLQSKPRIASIGLTLRCNLNCIMCFTQKMQKKDMNHEIFNNISQLFPTLEEARWNDAGELFASQKIKDYLAIINRQKVPKSYLSTNFKAAGEYMDDLLSGGFTHLSVSIDAATPETYTEIRRGGDFQDLLKNLDRFCSLKAERDLTYPFLTLVFIAMKRNIHELPAFVDLANRFGATEIHVLKLLPNSAHIEKTDSLSLNELQPHYQEAFGRARRYGIRLSHVAYTDDELLKKLPQDRVNADHMAAVDFALSDRRSQFEFGGYPFCRSPWTEILIDVDGKVRPCCYHQKVLGDLNSEAIFNIWNNDAYQEFRSKILAHDFSECHHCPWLHKVFHYQVPTLNRNFHPLNQRLHSLEQGWDLTRDIFKRSSPFTDLKIELDPLAYKLNKNWDFGDLLPAPESQFGTPETFEHRRGRIEEEKMVWTQSTPEMEIPSRNKMLNFFSRNLKKVIKRILRFYTGKRFAQQRETNLWFFDQIGTINAHQEKLTYYLSTLKSMMDHQKEFNSLLVQYLNLFSDRIFDRLERQKNMNMEIVQTIRQTNERIDRLNRDQHLFFELLSNLARETLPGPENKDTFPSSLSEIFFSGTLTVEQWPQKVFAGQSFEVKVTIHNTSFRTWTPDSPSQVGVDYAWLTVDGQEQQFADHARIWLPTSLTRHDRLTITSLVRTPSKAGSFTLFLFLVSGDGRRFPDFGQGSIQVLLNIGQT
ncbi:radical SAM/SPASM domain-containing protein [candidate division CSSED10-310 bacterium]|uniref:Radical SAM/SPASM domain-containing protein n=1 Tax=candidate division CSSED10-310 bacterium TaxID=2855610 RepID=A0ABV6YSN8_UNCC1